MNAEKGKGPDSHPVLGRFHGFSATGITVAEFTKIIQSLHRFGGDKVSHVHFDRQRASSGKVCAEDSPESFQHDRLLDLGFREPYRYGNHLNAVEKNGNQFNEDGLKEDGECSVIRRPIPRGSCATCTRGERQPLQSRDSGSGGGTLTTASTNRVRD